MRCVRLWRPRTPLGCSTRTLAARTSAFLRELSASRSRRRGVDKVHTPGYASVPNGLVGCSTRTAVSKLTELLKVSLYALEGMHVLLYTLWTQSLTCVFTQVVVGTGVEARRSDGAIESHDA